MNLEELGYNASLEGARTSLGLCSFAAGRVIAEHRERYWVATGGGEVEAEISGNLRFSAMHREDFPAVGDWVAISLYDNNFAIIHRVFPRYSVIRRKAAGSNSEVQVIAANIDVGFLCQAADRDFSINRLERYLTICHAAHIKPAVILGKIDLVAEDEVNLMISALRSRIIGVPVFPVSHKTQQGYEDLMSFVEKGKTYCLLGSSGVGKSTLINNLTGERKMKTGPVSSSTNKGMHVTSHRELFLLPQGALLVDNPGMREVGIADDSGGLETTFMRIEELARQCRFSDCSHSGEKGCAVLAAAERGEVDTASLRNYKKMQKEKLHFESSLAERHKKDKEFGKMVKNYHRTIKRNSQEKETPDGYY